VAWTLDERNMTMEHWWNDDIDRGRSQYLEKTLSQCHFFYHKVHLNWPWVELQLPMWEAGDYTKALLFFYSRNQIR